MAICTIYGLSTLEKGTLEVAVTGNVKKKVKSKLDDDWGEEMHPMTPKLHKSNTTDKLDARLECVLVTLQHLQKIGCTSADRNFAWFIDKDVVELLNKHTPVEIINKVGNDAIASVVKKIFDLKMSMGTRIGFQDPTKRNRFIDQAKGMLAMAQAPAIPEWEHALSTARRKTQLAQVRNELEAMDKAQQQEPVQGE